MRSPAEGGDQSALSAPNAALRTRSGRGGPRRRNAGVKWTLSVASTTASTGVRRPARSRPHPHLGPARAGRVPRPGGWVVYWPAEPGSSPLPPASCSWGYRRPLLQRPWDRGAGCQGGPALFHWGGLSRRSARATAWGEGPVDTTDSLDPWPSRGAGCQGGPALFHWGGLSRRPARATAWGADAVETTDSLAPTPPRGPGCQGGPALFHRGGLSRRSARAIPAKATRVAAPAARPQRLRCIIDRAPSYEVALSSREEVGERHGALHRGAWGGARHGGEAGQRPILRAAPRASGWAPEHGAPGCRPSSASSARRRRASVRSGFDSLHTRMSI